MHILLFMRLVLSVFAIFNGHFLLTPYNNYFSSPNDKDAEPEIEPSNDAREEDPDFWVTYPIDPDDILAIDKKHFS